jgi:hypothetical protein
MYLYVFKTTLKYNKIYILYLYLWSFENYIYQNNLVIENYFLEPFFRHQFKPSENIPNKFFLKLSVWISK